MSDITITQGSTFSQVIRWETTPIVYKPITDVEQVAPAVVHCLGHGVPSGWRAALVSIRGPVELNAANNPPKAKDYHKATVLSPDILAFNDLNAADLNPYVGGGYVQYNTPVDLTGYTARMEVKDQIGGTVLASLTTENGGIVLDAVNCTITLNIPASSSAAYTWSEGVTDIEMIDPNGVVTKLPKNSSGATIWTVAVLPEVTT